MDGRPAVFAENWIYPQVACPPMQTERLSRVDLVEKRRGTRRDKPVVRPEFLTLVKSSEDVYHGA
jgi:hypothetical protein